MSARESSDLPAPAASAHPAAPGARAGSTRWPGLLRLGLDVLGGPVIALVNQQVLYAGDVWACGHNTRWSLHIGAALCLVAAVAVAIDGWIVWRGAGVEAEDGRGGERTRTRFLATVGLMIAAISIAVILAQWLAIFMFGACMRA